MVNPDLNIDLDQEQNYHFYLFSFYIEQGTEGDKYNAYHSRYLPLEKPKVTAADIDLAIAEHNGTLISVSYLGYMTPEEFYDRGEN